MLISLFLKFKRPKFIKINYLFSVIQFSFKDVELLSARLNSVVFHYKTPINTTFNHYDFIWGKSSLQMVSRPILQLLAQYQ